MSATERKDAGGAPPHPTGCSCKACVIARIQARRTPAGIGAARQAGNVDASRTARAAMPMDAPALEHARATALHAMRMYRLTPDEARAWEDAYVSARNDGATGTARAMCFDLELSDARQARGRGA